jgi:hypothetical protein
METPMTKQPLVFADTLPVHFRRACSAASGDGGLRSWLDTRFGAGKWILGEYPRDGAEIALNNHAYADLAIEYGYQRLSAIFSSLDPVAAAAPVSSQPGKSQ